MRRRLEEMMRGRYGMDQLSRFMMWAGIAVLILNIFLGIPILGTLALVDIILIYVRMFSRNYARMSAQNQKYLKLKYQVKQFFGDIPGWFRKKREYHIYRCPECGQKIRIPRGRGRIAITCPKCRNEFIRKS